MLDGLSALERLQLKTNWNGFESDSVWFSNKKSERLVAGLIHCPARKLKINDLNNSKLLASCAPILWEDNSKKNLCFNRQSGLGNLGDLFGASRLDIGVAFFREKFLTKKFSMDSSVCFKGFRLKRLLKSIDIVDTATGQSMSTTHGHTEAIQRTMHRLLKRGRWLNLLAH